MEGFSLTNIFFLGKNKKDFLVSNDGLVIQYGLVMADVAPLIHYGATVSLLSYDIKELKSLRGWVLFKL